MPWPDCAPCHSLPDGGGGNRPPSGQPNVPANSRQSGLRVPLAASSPRYLALTNIRRRSQSLPAATEDRHRPPLPLSPVPLLHSHPFGGFGLRDSRDRPASLSPNPPKDTDGRREESGRGGGEGATGEIAWVPFGVGRSADDLHRRTGTPMAVCGSCDARDGERIRSRELSRTGLARVCGDFRLSGGWVGRRRCRQAGSGMDEAASARVGVGGQLCHAAVTVPSASRLRAAAERTRGRYGLTIWPMVHLRCECALQMGGCVLGIYG